MPDKADHITWAAEAIAAFQQHCHTGDEHAIADLVCDLGHLADQMDNGGTDEKSRRAK
jgi:hypothetical protein